MWSSPISASTPPCFEEPAKLAWRKTSPVRSTPGPLPYQSPNTPSYLPSPRSSACCEPHSAVGGQVLVEAGLEDDIGCGEVARRAHELLVEPAERGAAIAGDEAGGIQPGAAVALLLHQAHPDDGLIAGHEELRLREVVFIVEADGPKRHDLFFHDFMCAATLNPAGPLWVH